MSKAVVQSLVVAIVKPQLLHSPFEVPVHFANKREVWRLRAYRRNGFSVQKFALRRHLPQRHPEVLRKISLSRSIAISQRTPSHWLATYFNAPINADLAREWKTLI